VDVDMHLYTQMHTNSSNLYLTHLSDLLFEHRCSLSKRTM